MSIRSFQTFLEETAPKAIWVAFGRYQPPTLGHQKVFEKLASLAVGKIYRIYSSHSEDPKKNPLPYSVKIQLLRKLFPRHARAIVSDDANSILDIAAECYVQGFTEFGVVTGSDRVSEFQALLDSYNGKQMVRGLYNFKEIRVVSAGDRDPDGDESSAISGTRMREAAKNNDLEEFSRGLPRVGDSGAKEVFNAVRRGLGLRESSNFRKHLRLATVSELREAYVRGEVFRLGDSVTLRNDDEIGRIASRGANFVIVEVAGKRLRKWLEDVSPLVEEIALEQPVIAERVTFNPIRLQPVTRVPGTAGRTLSEFRKLR